MHHLLLIRPVKLEWLIGVAYLPVPVCALCRGKVQSLSPPPPSPPYPGGVGKHDNLRWIKNWSLCHKSWFVRYQEVPLLWWNDRVSEEKKVEENPLAEASRTLNPAGCQSCLWEEPWVWLLILSLARSPVSRLPQHAGLALSPLFDIFICSAKATGWLACELSTKVDYSPCLSP